MIVLQDIIVGFFDFEALLIAFDICFSLWPLISWKFQPYPSNLFLKLSETLKAVEPSIDILLLSKNTIKFLITKDQELTENGKVPVLFWYSIITPKPQNEISNNVFLPSKN